MIEYMNNKEMLKMVIKLITNYIKEEKRKTYTIEGIENDFFDFKDLVLEDSYKKRNYFNNVFIRILKDSYCDYNYLDKIFKVININIEREYHIDIKLSMNNKLYCMQFFHENYIKEYRKRRGLS